MNLANILKRPEVGSLIVALIVAALVATGLPATVGLEIPEPAIGQVVSIFLAVFVGYVFEGKYKGVDYAGGVRQLVASRKFRLALIALGGMLVNALLAPLGYALPDETVATLGDFILLAVLAIAGLDGWRASQSPS